MNENRTIDISVKYTDGYASHAITVDCDLLDAISEVRYLCMDLDPTFAQQIKDDSDYYGSHGPPNPDFDNCCECVNCGCDSDKRICDDCLAAIDTQIMVSKRDGGACIALDTNMSVAEICKAVKGVITLHISERDLMVRRAADLIDEREDQDDLEAAFTPYGKPDFDDRLDDPEILAMHIAEIKRLNPERDDIVYVGE